jgi:Fuc2NAc and GlcNAc transferase
VIGLWDDFRSVPAWVRLAVHLIASSIVIYWLVTAHSLPFLTGAWGWLGVTLAVIGLSWLLNLFNFMDGIDGIAGLETISVAGSAMLLLWFAGATDIYIYWLGILVVATAGFLAWNWPPAKIFMGDACSGFLGFCLGIFAMLTSADTKMTLWSWFILLGVFIADATVTLLQRIWRKERFFEAHRSHAYQILARRWHSHKKVTLGVLAVNVLWLLPWAFFSISWPCYGLLFALIAYVPLVIFCVKAGAGTINE